MMNDRMPGLTMAAAIATATVLMPEPLWRYTLEHFTKAEAEVPHRSSIVSVNRSFASSPTQIEYCLIEEQRDDSMGLEKRQKTRSVRRRFEMSDSHSRGDAWAFNEDARERL